MDSLAFTVGLATISLSLMVKVLGEPDQILRNYYRKSTEGVSLLNYSLGFLAYAAWVFHGVLRGDMVIIVSQSLGVIMTGVVLTQFILYRKRESPSGTAKS